MIRLPSMCEPRHEFFSGDDAIEQPPEDPKALAEYDHKIRVARQTGDLAGVLVNGQQPVRFLMRPIPFEAYAVVMGMRDRQEPLEDILLLAARVCLLDIDGAEVKKETHPRFGKIASLSTFEKFGVAQGLNIACELGTLALQRAHADPLR